MSGTRAPSQHVLVLPLTEVLCYIELGNAVKYEYAIVMCKHVSYFTQMNKYGGLFKGQERSKKEFLPFWRFYDAHAGLFKYIYHGAYKNITLQ